MALKAIITSYIDYGLNRQFMYKIKINNTKFETYVAIHPIAEQAIKNSHSSDQHFKNELERVASTIFEGSYSNDVKGRLAETYITTILEIDKRVQFKITGKQKTQNPVYNLKRQLQTVVKFLGNSLPFENVDLSKTTFFLPLSPNYPGVNFLIWDHEKKLLFAFQITIGNLKDHYESRNKFTANRSDSLVNKWAELCKIKKIKVIFVWFAPENFRDRDNEKDSLYFFNTLLTFIMSQVEDMDSRIDVLQKSLETLMQQAATDNIIVDDLKK
ncbi:6654_t:CDS:2 [Racocetra fulgida]|uniref:6654_t:CDS:1 n=1 Tax=Racocetra fulgida TaxID=60492 RepID=A0A9N9H4I0_9GLOM|nr:6654_t:CDS:2 [Racocetra fulgida]